VQRGKDMTQALPYKVGQVLTAEIRAVAFGGDGLARVDGFVVFVPFTLEGISWRSRSAR